MLAFGDDRVTVWLHLSLCAVLLPVSVRLVAKEIWAWGTGEAPVKRYWQTPLKSILRVSVYVMLLLIAFVGFLLYETDGALGMLALGAVGFILIFILLASIVPVAATDGSMLYSLYLAALCYGAHYARIWSLSHFFFLHLAYIPSLLLFPVVMYCMYVAKHATVYSSIELGEPLLADTTSPQEKQRGVFSTFYFTWVYPLLRKGYSKGFLTQDDLAPVPYQDTPEYCFDAFDMHYDTDKGNIVQALYRANRFSFLLCGFILLLSTSLSLVPPYILSVLLKHIKLYPTETTLSYVLTVVLFLSSIIQSCLEHQFWIVGTRCALRCQNALMVKVYRTSLHFNRATTHTFEHGSVVNHLSVDACRIADKSLVPMIHWGTWSALIVFIVANYNLYLILGTSFFLGLGAMLFCWPISLYIGVRFKSASRQVQMCRDVRANIMSDIINMIMMIKCLLLQNVAKGMVFDAREKELGAQYYRLLYKGSISTLSIFSGVMAPICAFAYHAYIQRKPLDAATVFASLAWFSLLKFPLKSSPSALTSLMDVLVSLQRLNSFFQSEVKDPVPQGQNPEHRVILDHASFAWKRDCDPILRDLNLRVPSGELVVVTGPIASGKTSLLCSLLAESYCIEGSYSLYGTAALVEPSSWLQNKSIRENILMGKPFDPDRYNKTLRSCALVSDLEMLLHGDAQQVAEGGVNLSGGQKQRICLARAVYSNADIYLLDDVLSALDSIVANHVFEECIVKHLTGTTRIVVTHQTHFLSHPAISRILVLGTDGRIYAEGRFSMLLQQRDAYIQTLLQNADEDELQNSSIRLDDKCVRNTSPAQVAFVSEEEAVQGTIDFRILAKYLGSMKSISTVLILLVSFLGEQAMRIVQSLFLSKVTSVPHHQQRDTFDLVVVFAAAICLFAVLRALCMIKGSLRAAGRIHERVYEAIIAAPMHFFDRQRSGRIMNRVIADQCNVDGVIPTALSNLMQSVLGFLSILFLIAFNIPYLLVVIIALAVPYLVLSNFYRWSARDLRRLEAISKSPLNSHLTQTMRGISIIHCFQMEREFESEFKKLVECSFMCSWNQWCANQWVTVWLEVIGNVFSALCFLFVVYFSNAGSITPGEAGLVLSNAITIPFALGWLLKLFVTAEIEFVSLERVMEYSSLEPEELALTSTTTAHAGNGAVEFDGLSLAYGSGNTILHDIHLSIPGGSQVAIVGRTGAGKSSIFHCLLRLYPFNGSIMIDCMPIHSLNLQQARELCSIVPQNPALFGVTLKDALTCGKQTSDQRILQMLDRIELKETVLALSRGLQTCLSDCSFSSGQKQLLCIVRALLRESRLILCDEVSSAVDVRTETISNTILAESGATVLSICHRLQHIRAYDLVVVLDRGHICEYGPPGDLLQDETSELSRLAMETQLFD